MKNENIMTVKKALASIPMLNIRQQQSKIAVLNIVSVDAPNSTAPGNIDIVLRYAIIDSNGEMTLLNAGVHVEIDNSDALTSKNIHEHLVNYFSKQIKTCLKLIASHMKNNTFKIAAIKQYDIDQQFNGHLIDVTPEA